MCYQCRALIEERKPAVHPQCQEFYDEHLSHPAERAAAIEAFNRAAKARLGKPF